MTRARHERRSRMRGGTRAERKALAPVVCLTAPHVHEIDHPHRVYTACGLYRRATRVTSDFDTGTCPACVTALAQDTVARLSGPTRIHDVEYIDDPILGDRLQDLPDFPEEKHTRKPRDRRGMGEPRR